MGGEGQRRDYTHVIWADKVEPLWKQLNDRNSLLILEVQMKLPQSLIDCLLDVAGINRDFKIFPQAVRDTPIEKVTCYIEDQTHIQTGATGIITLSIMGSHITNVQDDTEILVSIAEHPCPPTQLLHTANPHCFPNANDNIR
jgi:hypothetical protein